MGCTMKKSAAVLLALLSISLSFADERPERYPRVWGLKEEGEVQSTLQKIEKPYVYFTLTDGSVRKVHVWRINSKDLAYLQRQMCTFPPEIRHVTLPPDANLLLDISAENLPAGPLTTWENKGALGGAFHALNTPPIVETVAGRKAVSFDYGPWALPMEFQPMVADVYAPESITDGKSFTVVAWLYNSGPVAMRQSFLSWNTIHGDEGTDLGYGAEGRYDHEKGTLAGAYNGPLGGVGFPDKNFPEGNQWHHLAYVNTGGRDGVFRLYVDGQLVNEHRFDRMITLRPATDITSTSAVLNAELFNRDGKRVEVWGYCGTNDNHYWRWLRWTHGKNLGEREPGIVSMPVDNLLPGTEYFYRFYYRTDKDARMTEKAGSFITADTDGTPGKNLPGRADKLMFLDCHWGSTWDWAAKPTAFFNGSIAEVKLFDNALSEREIRNLMGTTQAYREQPADGSVLTTRLTRLSWKPCVEGVARYAVYLSHNREAVENVDASALKATVRETTCDPEPLAPGKTYYWRINQLDSEGTMLSPGAVWRFTAMSGNACNPFPAQNATNVPYYFGEVAWTPGPFAAGQTVYFDDNLKTVEKGTTRYSTKLNPDQKSWRMDCGLLEYGKTYYWRVETTNKNGVASSPGEVWQFTVQQYFTPEYDGIVSEPFPLTVKQNGYYGKFMDLAGQPLFSTADCPEDALRIAQYSCRKLMLKRPDIVKMLEARRAGGHIGHGDKPWGWSEFVCNTYGASKNMLSDPTFYWGQNMLIHEMGHQLHMNGAEALEPDFDYRLYSIYVTNQMNLKWLGDYGGNNMWEYMAVCASAFVNDGHKDDEICPRERLRNNDPLFYHFLREYWSGDDIVNLEVARGLRTDAHNAVLTWRNSGGLEYWGKFGWKYYAGTVGEFKPAGSPKLQTVAGVSSITFAGNDALVWTNRTRQALAGNHSWSVEFWAWKEKDNGKDETIISWGPADNECAQFVWSKNSLAFSGGSKRIVKWKQKPVLKQWQHIVYVFEGGGLDDGPGSLTVYVDGTVAASARVKLAIKSQQQIVIGAVKIGNAFTRGFCGSLAGIRIYDYDMSALQIRKHYADEQPYYQHERLNTAGNLLVDLDARVIAPPDRDDVQPEYPAGTGRQWLRSWVNRGIVAGRMMNDVHMPEGSDPLLRDVDGITAVAFHRNDRMVSSFTPRASVENGFGSVEAWVYCSPDEPDGTVMQWGGFTLQSSVIKPGGWHYVAVTCDGSGANLFIDGRIARAFDLTSRITVSDHLHLGAAWNGTNWHSWFSGAISQLRIHSAVLTANQISKNFTGSDMNQASQPYPAVDARVPADGSVALLWHDGVPFKGRPYILYLGKDYDAVARADTKSPLNQGRFVSGQYIPELAPDTTYYWRVDGSDGSGLTYGKGTVWSFKTCQGTVIDLDAAGLEKGTLERWNNNGSAGGAFVKGDGGGMHDPVVEQVAGRMAVTFDGRDTYMQSDKPTPAVVCEDRPFTVEMVVYNPEVTPRETVFSLAPIVSMKSFPTFKMQRAAEFLYGKNTGWGPASFFTGREDRALAWKQTEPEAGKWHHIAFVYNGGQRGRVQVYVGGKRDDKHDYFALMTIPGYLMHLGASWDTDEGAKTMFSGSLARLQVYDYAKPDHEIKEDAEKALKE